MDLIDELNSRVLCADGAMGTALMEAADAPFDRCLEEFCLSAPDLVSKIHDQYIEAGARVIEANSFGANAVRLERYGLEGKVNEINWTAAQLAKQAAKAKGNVYVAGSVGPLGLTADEARDEVERFLDQAFLAGRPSVRVVHGTGMGILRRTLRDYLKRHPHVVSVTEPPYNEGGQGATLVELKA